MALMRLLSFAAYFFFAFSPLVLAQVAPEQEGGQTIDLATFVRQFREYTQRVLTSKSYMKRQPDPAIAALTSDPNLARAPYIRNVMLGVFQEFGRLKSGFERTTNEMPKPKPYISSGDDGSRRNRMPKFKDPFAGHREREEKQKVLMAASEKYIENQLATLEKQANTAQGQQFSLPANSPAYLALGGKVPDLPGGGMTVEISFEAVSEVEGGMIAYVMRAERISPSGNPNTVASGTTGPTPAARVERALVADRSVSYMVQGYKKPVRMGDRIKLQVRRSGTVKIGTTTVPRYIVVE